LITLPLRLGFRGAELGLRAGQAVAERAIGLVGEVLAPTADEPKHHRDPPSSASRAREDETETLTRAPEREPAEAEGADPRSAAPPPEQVVDEQEAAAAQRPAPVAPEPPRSAPSDPPAPPSPPVPPAPQPEHVEEEVELVREVADPGAEEGAGAQISIAEPWEGYAELKAADGVDPLAGRDQVELAAIELYELSHRKRQTVLDAAQRELRRVSGS
jgi:hypothetical protein